MTLCCVLAGTGVLVGVDVLVGWYVGVLALLGWRVACWQCWCVGVWCDVLVSWCVGVLALPGCAVFVFGVDVLVSWCWSVRTAGLALAVLVYVWC